MMIVCIGDKKLSLTEKGYEEVENGQCDVMIVSSFEEAREVIEKGTKVEICSQGDCLEELRRKIFKVTRSCKFS